MKLDIINADSQRLLSELKRVGVDDYALNMFQKGVCLNITVRDVSTGFANILKQEAIASGMDVAVKRGVVTGGCTLSDVLILGNLNSYKRLTKRLDMQPFGLKKLASELKEKLKFEKVKSFTSRQVTYSLEKPLIMGILNITPDSFSDGGKNLDCVENSIDELLEQGADIIDIGGESTRPKAESITPDVEIERIKNAVEYAMAKGTFVSVDTYNYETAKFAITKGVHMINDVTGMKDERMRKLCGQAGVSVCVMHMLKSPIDMQENICYNDILYDIKSFFYDRIDLCLNDGIRLENIVLDVGFGFGKTLEQNYTLLKNLGEFKSFGLPILVGLSRKSMLQGDVADRDFKSVVANTIAVANGADIVRVHNVSATKDMLGVMNKLV